MESNYQEESTNWYEEVDKENNVDLGVGRLYECVFCKRGFNTAQALGGHMNIHRRDRAKNNSSSTNSNKHEENYHYFGQRFYQMPESSYNQSLNHHFVYYDHHQPITAFPTYFPPSTSSTKSSYKSQYFPDQQHIENPLVDEDWSMSLSLDYNSTILEDLEKSREVIVSEKEELDLELRLGYDS